MAQPSPNQTGIDDGAVYWPRLDFVIPFNIDAAGQSPREIQLEWSEDRGRSWGLYSSGDVRTKQFHFKAKEDGEYRFRLKTLDNQGRSFDNPGEPLKVIVDTTKPEAKLLVDIDPRGTMMAEFELLDPAIDVSTIKLAYQTEGLSQWREIAIDVRPGENPAAWIGYGSWNLPTGTRQLVVRLSAKDKAGNSVEETRLPQLPRSAAAQGNLQLASGKPRDLGAPPARSNGQPIGSGVVDFGPESLPKVEVLGKSRTRPALDHENSPPVAAPQRTQTPAQPFVQPPNAHAGVLTSPPPTQPYAYANPPSNLDSDRTGTESVFVANRALNPLPKQDPAKSDSNLIKLPVREITDQELEQFRSNGPVNLVTKRSDPTAPQNVGIELPATPSNLLATDPKATRIANPSPFQRDIKPLYCNSKAFSLDYSIDNDPDSPVSSVELWGSSDQGQSWHLWGQDPDRESPFDIEVESQGLFGFRMVIVGANGLASNRPRNGDNADSWIQVDTQEPQAKIISALYGKGKESGSMIIEYRAGDDYFPERPITLSYSPSPNGPWTQIATGVRNNGRFVWPADPALPPSVYLRIEANDAAGNVAVDQLDQPIDVEGLAPRGRIQGFRPLK